MYLRFFLISLALLIFSCVQAQDKIVKSNNEVIEAKVLEITQTEITYKKFSNPEGPTYTIDKSEVVTIIFENGEIEVIKSSYTNSSSENPSSKPKHISTLNIDVLFGANFATAIGSDARSDRNANNSGFYGTSKGGVYPLVGPNFSVLVDYRFLSFMGAGGGLGVSNKGWWEFSKSSYSGSTIKNRTFYNLVFVEIPIFSKLYLGKSFTIKTGPTLGFLVFNNVRQTQITNGDRDSGSGSFNDAFRESPKFFVPAYVVGMSVGKSDGIHFNLDFQITSKFFSNSYNYRNFLVQAGVGFTISKKVGK